MANAEWWAEKLQLNVVRDRETNAFLEEHGWLVLRFWEHAAAVEAADTVETAVKARRHSAENTRVGDADQRPDVAAGP